MIFERATAQTRPHPAWDEALQTARRVDLNTADAATLARLPQVGPSLAERIVAYREQHGQFLTREELMRVPGIGPSTFAQLAEHVSVE
jgi:competence protein ComEA